MILLRSLLFNILFIAWNVLIQVAYLPLLLLPYTLLLRANRFWIRGILVLLAGICDLRHEIRGLDNLPDTPCILASKHQSAWDTFIFALIVNGPGFVFKRELLWIPLFGWYIMHAGCIPVDRRGGAQALKRMVAAARQVLDQGRNIIIFPEGTRTYPGEHRPHHPGVAALYTRLNVPVVPVALNSGLFWPRRSFIKRPGVITLEILPPIAPGLKRKDFTAELENRIETASNRLIETARYKT